jgi:uncharacterized protein (DUF3084 family)
MTEKRYILSHNGKEDGILDKTNDKGYYGFELARLVNELSEENEQLKQAYQTLKSRHSLLHDECLEAECDRDSLKKDVISLEKENEQLKKELFESEKDYLIETYSDNPTRRDEKIQGLKEEFKARFGDVE